MISEYLECLLVMHVAIWHKTNPSLSAQTYLLWAIAVSFLFHSVHGDMAGIWTTPSVRGSNNIAAHSSTVMLMGVLKREGQKDLQGTWTALCYIKFYNLLFFFIQKQPKLQCLAALKTQLTLCSQQICFLSQKEQWYVNAGNPSAPLCWLSFAAMNHSSEMEMSILFEESAQTIQEKPSRNRLAYQFCKRCHSSTINQTETILSPLSSVIFDGFWL